MKMKLYIPIMIMNIAVASSVFGLTTFNPSLSVSGEITDNLYLTHQNALSELITFPSADLELIMASQTSSANLSYTPSFSFYKNYSENNAFRQEAGLSFTSDLAKNTHFEITDAFLKTEDPLTEDEVVVETTDPLVSEPDTTVRTGRRIYYANRARTLLTHRLGQTDSISLAYGFSILENQDPEVEDNKRYSPSMRFVYWLGPKWGTETEVTLEKGEFEISDDFDNTIGIIRLIRQFTRRFQGFVGYSHTDINFKGNSEDYAIYEPSLGIRLTMDENSNISLATGYYVRDMTYSESETGYILNGDLGKRWTFRRSSFSLNGSSGYEQAHFGSENLGFAKYYGITGTARYEFTRHLRVDAYMAYRHTKYEDLIEKRKDKSHSLGCSLNYQITKWLSSSLAYSYRAINSTDDEREYIENRVMIMMSVSPMEPYRL